MVPYAFAQSLKNRILFIVFVFCIAFFLDIIYIYIDTEIP